MAVVVNGTRLELGVELGIERCLKDSNLVHRIRKLGINITQACDHILCTPHQQPSEVGMQLYTRPLLWINIILRGSSHD
jgi:hypothetical protein